MNEQRGAGRRRLGERLFGAPAEPSALPEQKQAPQRAGAASTQAASTGTASTGTATGTEPAPRSVRWAAAMVGLETLGAVAGAAATVWFAVTGQVSSTRNAIGIVAVAVLGALLLAACARGLWRVASWARGPVVAVQLLLALIGYTAAFEYSTPQVGVPLLVLAAAELYFLATPEARLAYFRR